MSEIKLSDKLQKIAQEIEKLTIGELADLAKYLEEKFGVTAMPVAAAVAPTTTAGQSAGAPSEEKTTFDLILSAAGANKLAVIKAVREILPNLGLMDAKKLVESAPKPILEGAKKETAEEAKKKLETAGAKVELK